MLTKQEILKKCTKTKITIIIVTIIFIYLFMFRILIHERFYIHNSKSFKISQKVVTKRLLRIAQISPPEISVPPKKYGSIERTISYLTEELVKRGHDQLIHYFRPAYNKEPIPMERYEWLFNQVRMMAAKFEILHFHTGEHFEFVDEICKGNRVTCIVTAHDFMKWYPTLGFEHNRLPLITISDDQKLHSSGNPNYIGTAYHGLPKNQYKFIEKPFSKKPYLAFLARMVPEKKPDMAIEIAVKLGFHLKIGAKIIENYYDYWDKINKLIEKHKNIVEFVGEVNETQKNDFLGNANAFLNPINWPEPFGMVMIESMACGTPVVARNMGAVPEVIDDGISGVTFNTVEEGVEAVKKAIKMNRKKVREAFERRFTIEKNVDRIEEIYIKRLNLEKYRFKSILLIISW
ncbi:Glycos_transf_1 domain-containing protein [Meloidogyne graminicola]|uniref:Glycos_transf_1 domain-containing protein n=1 Tax=Meloidogyne graminicola TaxID=189291 RepID=A0A8S9ZFJ2_9BILA|nr:Glycos_transf_1 domain-containing protein [Meloidogyne graminicola]